MKITLQYVLVTTYDNTTNVGTYQYKITPVRVVTIANADIWKLNFMKLSYPTTSLTFTAYTATSTTGTVPAYAGRTCAISQSGKCTFVDAYETPLRISILSMAVSEAPDHPYLIWDIINVSTGNSAAFLSTSITIGGTTYTATAPVDDLIVEDQTAWGVDGSTIDAVWRCSATDVAALQLPPLMTWAWAEGDLLSREYSGKLIEVGLKALIIMSQAKRKGGNQSKALLGSAILEVADYMQGDGPFDVYIPSVMHTCQMGVP